MNECLCAEIKIACPFCDDRDDHNPSVSPVHGYNEPGTNNTRVTGYIVECDKCGAMGPKAGTIDEAIALYNKGFDPALRLAAKVVEGSTSWGLSPTKLEAVKSFQRHAVKVILAQTSNSEERARHEAKLRLVEDSTDIPS